MNVERQDWDVIALELGLQVRWGGPWRRPPMRGHYEGLGVQVRILPPGGSRSGALSTEIRMQARGDVPGGLWIVPETSKLRLAERLGIGDIRIGDEKLDARVKVGAADPDRARTILTTPFLRDVLVDLFGRHEHIEVGEGAVVLEKLGVAPSAEVVRAWLEDLVYLVDALEAAATGWSFDFDTSDGELPRTGEIRTARPPRRPTEAATEELKAVVRFRRRVAVGVVAGLVPAMGGLMLALYGGTHESGAIAGLAGYWWVAIGMAVCVAGIVAFMATYRCPVCGRVPMPVRTGEGAALFPSNCPECGSRLR